MAEVSITTKLLDDPRTKCPKQMCFSLRKRLDGFPGLMKQLRLVAGGFTLSHFLLSFAFLIVILTQLLPGYQNIEISIYPMLALSLEIEILCIVMISIIFTDILNSSMTMAVWQRSAIGRLLRNFFIALMLLVFFSLCIANITASRTEFTFYSAASNCTPVILLLIVSLAKIVLIKTDFSATWIALWLCFVSELGFLIAYADFGVQIPWIVAAGPLDCVCVTLLVDLMRRVDADSERTLAGAMSCLSCGFYLSMKAAALDGFIEDSVLYNFPAILAFVLIYCYYSELSGGIIVDVIFGHIETDYFYFVNPPRKDGKVKAITI